MILAIAAVVPVILMPRQGTAWPLAAIAPALGLAGLAGAWPALAGRGRGSAWRRAALGFIGWAWLALAAPLTSGELYARRPPGLPTPELWTSSLTLTVHDVLWPILSSGILAGGLAWAAGAAILPWLARGRSLARDAVLVCVWSAAMLSASEVLIAAAQRIRPGSGPEHGDCRSYRRRGRRTVSRPGLRSTRRVSPGGFPPRTSVA